MVLIKKHFNKRVSKHERAKKALVCGYHRLYTKKKNLERAKNCYTEPLLCITISLLVILYFTKEHWLVLYNIKCTNNCQISGHFI